MKLTARFFHKSLENLFYFPLAFLIFFISCEKPTSHDQNLRSVIVVKPQVNTEFKTQEYSGTVQEGKSVNAAFMADGKINKIYVKQGDRVRKGQLIATLDDEDYQIGLNQLKTQFDQMTREKARMDEMYSRHNIAPNDYEKFTAGYEQLKLQLEMTENKVSYTKLYSPTDGYISEKYMEPGELTGAGTPIVKVTDDSELIADVDLPVSLYLDRKNIKEVSGSSPALPDEFIPLKIESFTPDISNNMIYQMKLSIPNKYASLLSPGMNLRVFITLDEKGNEGCVIPVRAIFKDGDNSYVWRYSAADSTIHKQKVMPVGFPEGKDIFVEGLSDSDLIIETGVKQLYEGEKVHVVDNSDFGI